MLVARTYQNQPPLRSKGLMLRRLWATPSALLGLAGLIAGGWVAPLWRSLRCIATAISQEGKLLQLAPVRVVRFSGPPDRRNRRATVHSNQLPTAGLLTGIGAKSRTLPR